MEAKGDPSILRFAAGRADKGSIQMKSQLRRMVLPAAGVCAGVLLAAGASLGAAATAAKSGAPSPTIMGAAWKADNSPIPQAKLRLRNVDTGRVVAATLANDAGQFVFADIETGSYIVELISNGGKLLAVGHTITIGPGETVATFVRLGAKVPWFTGFFANAASAVATAAASTGVTAMAPEEMQCASPPCK
jgi:hypothetical protein